MRKATSTNALNRRGLLYECPFARTLDVVAPRWAAALIFKLGAGSAPQTFGQLHAQLPGVSNKMLALRLRELAAAGVLVKRVTPSDPPAIDYALTPQGEALMPVLQAMQTWANGYLLVEASAVTQPTRKPSPTLREQRAG